MSESKPDRLDHIGANLERVSQQMDNQVEVNADLRMRMAGLTELVNTLVNNVTTLTGAVNTLTGTVTNLSNVVMSQQRSIAVLTSAVQSHETQMREFRQDMRDTRGDILELYSQNRRILELLEVLSKQ